MHWNIQIYSRFYKELIFCTRSVCVRPHISICQILLSLYFLISDSRWEEFAIRLYDPVQFLVLCPSWRDCLLLQHSVLFTEQQRRCRTRLSYTIISVTICCCQRKIQMDRIFALGKLSTVKAERRLICSSSSAFRVCIHKIHNITKINTAWFYLI